MVPRLMPARKTHSSPFSDSPQAKSARNSSPSGLSKPQLPADPLQLFHRSRQAFPLAPSPSGVESIVARYRLPIRRVNNRDRSEEHTSELQSLRHLVCRLLLEKK